MIVVGRAIGGVSLNGLEFLLDGPGRMQFESKEAAMAFLRENDLDGTDEEMENYYTFMTEEEAVEYESNRANAEG
jgi:hypothetical protein